jgi:hypothetical protein
MNLCSAKYNTTCSMAASHVVKSPATASFMSYIFGLTAWRAIINARNGSSSRKFELAGPYLHALFDVDASFRPYNACSKS